MTAPACAPLVELVVAEDFDASSAMRLHARLEEALALRPQRLVVDLSRCTGFDASALRVLLDVHCAAVRAGGVLVLRDPTPRVERVVGLSGLADVFTVQLS